MRLNLLDAEITQDFDTFMLSMKNEREYVLQALVEGKWANQYAFDLSPQDWIDFAPANHLSSTHPDAIFVQKLVVVLHNPNGRASLSGDMLKTVTGGRIATQTIRQEDIASILSDKFRLIS